MRVAGSIAAEVYLDMNEQAKNQTDPGSPARRRLLVSILSTYTATMVPWALAAPIKNDTEGAFMALSALLVGRKMLDTAMAERLYEALVKNDSDLSAAASALLEQINQQHIDPLSLQKVLDDTQSPHAAVPRKIVNAWYMGIVGEGADA